MILMPGKAMGTIADNKNRKEEGYACKTDISLLNNDKIRIIFRSTSCTSFRCRRDRDRYGQSWRP